MSVIYRNARAEDAARIAELERLYVDCAWSAAMIKDEIHNPDAVFVVADDGGAVGFLSGVIAADECEISDIAVDEAYRRQGIATELFARFTTEVRARGAVKLFLLVREDNRAAVALYNKLGFEAVGSRPRYYNDKTAVIMRKTL